MVEVMILLS